MKKKSFFFGGVSSCTNSDRLPTALADESYQVCFFFTEFEPVRWRNVATTAAIGRHPSPERPTRNVRFGLLSSFPTEFDCDCRSSVPWRTGGSAWRCFCWRSPADSPEAAYRSSIHKERPLKYNSFALPSFFQVTRVSYSFSSNLDGTQKIHYL